MSGRDTTTDFCSAVEAVSAVEGVLLKDVVTRLRLQDRVEAILLAPGGANTVDGALAIEAMRSADPELRARTLAEESAERMSTPCPSGDVQESDRTYDELLRLVRLEVAAIRVCLDLVELRSPGTATARLSGSGNKRATADKKGGNASGAVAVQEGFRVKLESLREREKTLVAAKASLDRREEELCARDSQVKMAAAMMERKAAMLRARESRLLAAEKELGLTCRSSQEAAHLSEHGAADT